MRKKLLIVISLYIIFIVSSVLVIKGYYNTNVTDYKQEYNISSLNFSVNGISAKNNTDSEGNIDESINTHTVDLTDIVLDHNDGFSVDLDLQARGKVRNEWHEWLLFVQNIKSSYFATNELCI